MNFPDAYEKLESIKQSHLLKYWDTLSSTQQTHLLEQIAAVDIETFLQQQHLVHSPKITDQSLQPFTAFNRIGSKHDQELGRDLIAKGMAGCLIVAGGQGTRLKFNGPKGMFPVTPVTHKSLFQLFAEKVIAAGKQVNKRLPLAIMTSTLNHKVTLDFFYEHQLFGLHPEQLSFFSQGTLPLLDPQGNLFLETPYTIAEGPDGNGKALHHFYQNGIWKQWQEKGVHYLNFVLIDNPLADPFDAELLGFLHRQQSDVVIKCIERNDPQESVGVLALKDGKAGVVEYSEMNDKDRMATGPTGDLLYKGANLSLFCFKMDFIKRVVEDKEPLSLHKAFKAVKFLNREGQTVEADKPMAWKFETFIFDLLAKTNKVEALLYPREQCFSPLKNFSGNFSIDTVRADIQRNDQRAFAEVTGKVCNLTPFEVPQEFYYPTPELRAKWRGKDIKDEG